MDKALYTTYSLNQHICTLVLIFSLIQKSKAGQTAARTNTRLKVQQFWREIRQTLETILGIKLVLDPKLFILGLYPDRHHMSRKIITALDLCLLLAKRVIALSWRSTSKPKLIN